MSTYTGAPVSSRNVASGHQGVQMRENLRADYADIFTSEALDALTALASFNEQQKELMDKGSQRRLQRFHDHEKIQFLDAESTIPRTQIKVEDARAGRYGRCACGKDHRRDRGGFVVQSCLGR